MIRQCPHTHTHTHDPFAMAAQARLGILALSIRPHNFGQGSLHHCRVSVHCCAGCPPLRPLSRDLPFIGTAPQWWVPVYRCSGSAIPGPAPARAVVRRAVPQGGTDPRGLLAPLGRRSSPWPPRSVRSRILCGGHLVTPGCGTGLWELAPLRGLFASRYLENTRRQEVLHRTRF